MTLEPGDILLWRIDAQAPLIDRLIGWGEALIGEKAAENRHYYHVAFVSAKAKMMYSSQPPKIDLYPIPDPLPDHVEVYRLKGGAAQAALDKVFDYAESRRGRWYPFLGVLTAGWLSGNLEFCSQLTQDSFFKYPICLCDDIRFATPDDIAASPFIQRVVLDAKVV